MRPCPVFILYSLSCIHCESQPLPGLSRAPTCPSALGSSLWVQIRVVAPASFVQKKQICTPPIDLGRKQNKFQQGFNSDQTHSNWNVCFAPTRGTKNNKETQRSWPSVDAGTMQFGLHAKPSCQEPDHCSVSIWEFHSRVFKMIGSDIHTLFYIKQITN